MRILVLVPSLVDLLGGIQTYSQALVWALSSLGEASGWKIDVLGLHDRSDAPAQRTGLANVQLAGFDGNRAAFAWASIRRARGADYILLAHVNFAPLVHAFRWVAPRAVCRVSAHGIDVWRRLGPLVSSGVRKAGEVWNVSDYSRRRMLEENPGLRDVRFSYLPNTLGPSYPPSGVLRNKQELGLDGRRVVLCVSRLSSAESYKNMDALLRAMPDVCRPAPNSYLVIVGPGDDRPRLEQMAATLGVTEHVRFTGRVSDAELQSYFAACDLFALPSTGEGFGIVFLEAMYHGKACIGARAGGVPEVIEDGVTGVLVEPDSLSSLAAVISRCLADGAGREAMGAAGRARLDRLFSPASFRSRVAGLLSLPLA